MIPDKKVRGPCSFMNNLVLNSPLELFKKYPYALDPETSQNKTKTTTNKTSGSV